MTSHFTIYSISQIPYLISNIGYKVADMLYQISYI